MFLNLKPSGRPQDFPGAWTTLQLFSKEEQLAFKDRVLLGAGLSDIIKAFTLVTKGYDNHKCPILPSAL